MALPTAQEIETMLGKIKKFPYLVSVGSTSMAPLAGAPTAEPDIETADVTLYETGTDVQARYVTKNSVTLTIRTRNIDAAMPLLEAVKKGDNMLAAANKKTITLVPITSETETTITFDNAYLNPGLSYAPGEGSDPNVVTLTYECKADPTRGTPFTYGSGSSSSSSNSSTPA